MSYPFKKSLGTGISLLFFLNLNNLLLPASCEESECPGSCSTLIACKSNGGKLMGFCMDGKICCGG